MSRLIKSVANYETSTQRMIREMGTSLARMNDFDRKFDYSFANKTAIGLNIDPYGLIESKFKLNSLINFDIRPYDIRDQFSDLFPKVNSISEHIKDMGIHLESAYKSPERNFIAPIFDMYDELFNNVWSDDFKEENEELLFEINNEIEMNVATADNPASEVLDASNARKLAIWILEKLILPTLFIYVAHFVNASDTGEKLDILNESIIETNIKHDISIDKQQINNEQLMQLNDTLNQLVQLMEQFNVDESDENPDKETEKP